MKGRVLLPLLLEGILHSDEEGRTVKVSPNNLSNLPNILYYFTDLRSADDILRRADLLTSFSLESGDRNVGALPFYISFTTNPSFRSGFPKNRQIDTDTNGKRHLLPLARFSVNVSELLKLSEKERAFTNKKKNGTLNSFEYQFTQRQRQQGKGPESEVRFCYRKPVLRKFVKAVDQITLCNTEYDTDWLQFLAKNIVDDAKLYGIPVKYVTDYGAEKEKDLQTVQNLYTPFGGKKFRNSNKALDFIPNKKLRSKFVNVFATCLVPSLIGERSTAAKINTFFRDIEKSFKSFWKGEYNETSIVEKDFTLFKKEIIAKAEEFIYNGNIPEREIQSNLNDCKHTDFEGFKGIQHNLLYHVFLFCKEHRNMSRAIQNLNNMLENMKSERELLRENLERFRNARSHKTEDPAKRSLKFRRLNESENRETYTLGYVTEESYYDIWNFYPDRIDVYLTNPDFSLKGFEFVESLRNIAELVDKGNFENIQEFLDNAQHILVVEDSNGRVVWENDGTGYDDAETEAFEYAWKAYETGRKMTYDESTGELTESRRRRLNESRRRKR